MTGIVFSIEEFSVYDGPGIRTSVFLKGCPLQCSWCHNPEGQLLNPQIVRSPNGCIVCGACERNGIYENGVFRFTEQSIKKCPNNLLRVCGEEFDSEELVQKLLKNERILKNGGGITFSGGEPFMQSNFLFDCLEKLHGRLHTAIQTCGFCDAEIFEKALTLADCFLFDLKLADEKLHQKYTGVSNQLILENYRKLVKSDRQFITRIPLIPGVTDTAHNTKALAKFIKENGVDCVELLPYNKMAGGKYKMLQREYNPDFDERIEVCVREDIFKDFNIHIKIL